MRTQAMTRLRSALCLALAGWAAGCHPDAITSSPVPSNAGVSFANLVPDTNKVIFRVVDIVSNTILAGATFRTFTAFPLGIQAGARHIRVFFDTTDVTLAQTVLLDTTFSFDVDQHYRDRKSVV